MAEMDSPMDRRTGDILRVLRALGGVGSRSEICAATGLARASVTEHVEAMLANGLLLEGDLAPSSGGRKAQRLRINPDSARIAIIDVGGSRSRVGLADLSGRMLDDDEAAIPVEFGPRELLGWAVEALNHLLAVHGRTDQFVVVVGLPGPVDFTTGRVVSPPIMSGWEGFDVPQYLNAELKAPVIVDNDVNLIALAEHRLEHPTSDVLLIVKLGTGIGGGIVIDGNVLRGSRGAAGDIGHTQARPPSLNLCRCGHVGCVEAVGGGWALVHQLQELGLDVSSVRDVAALAREGNHDAVAAVRQSARVVGTAVADAVSLLNPDTVVVVGDLINSGEQVLAMLREGVYQLSLPLATHHLVLSQGQLGPLVGLLGGAQLGTDLLLRTFTSRQPLGALT
jgi:predicted NBD/HSP70 family sugar kinase